ncbi:hypothetical protein Q0P20_14270, partial [Staphylococcus aureus]|nr:hypothetical protein [Staphylococcus aureus]
PSPPTPLFRAIFPPSSWPPKNSKPKSRKKGKKGDTEMLNTHTLPFSILLKHLSGLLSHERIHI